MNKKVDRRRKGVFGPPHGRNLIIFVDNLSMPEVEEYGAQPPIELLRQFVDHGGWYDKNDISWKKIVSSTLVTAMSPPGGSNNTVTPRFLRHFSHFCVPDFDDRTLHYVFSTIVHWHFSTHSFPADIASLADAFVGGTIDVYRSASSKLRPTPSKSHYLFNMRDVSRTIEGILMAKPQGITEGPMQYTRLWIHEIMRVFSDRLNNTEDRDWLVETLGVSVQRHMRLNMHSICEYLVETDSSDAAMEKNSNLTSNDLQKLTFGDYMDRSARIKIYQEVKSQSELIKTMEMYLESYNQFSKSKMDLVLFSFAVEHMSRICRLLRMPRGHALLVGVGGTGRQSLTRLAAFIEDCDMFQVDITNIYGFNEWREDLKTVVRKAGTGERQLVFLFTDTQVKQEAFVEDLNNLLNSGEIPGLLAVDERATIIESMRKVAKDSGKSKDMDNDELYAYFVERVRSQLHIVLAFSPIGDAFRERLLKYPSLVSCCTINWFDSWPQEALVAVANKFVSKVQFEENQEHLRHSVVEMCQFFHSSIMELSQKYLLQLKRYNYVTPTSYLELLNTFHSKLSERRHHVISAKKRYEMGLEKLAYASTLVNNMQQTLRDLQPVLQSSQKETEEIMAQIEAKLPEVQATRQVVQTETEIANKEAEEVNKVKLECEEDLSKALPVLESAIRALKTMDPASINEVRSLPKPPKGVRLAMEAVCIMLDVKPEKIKDPAGGLKKIDDYWGPSKRILGDSRFLSDLESYDKDDIPDRIMRVIRKKYLTDPEFTPSQIRNASVAAEGLCKWVLAIEQYDNVSKMIAPKKEALAKAHEELEVKLKALREKQASLRAVEDELAGLQEQVISIFIFSLFLKKKK